MIFGGSSGVELRQTIQGKKVIYIYHNTIDARGDNADTEMEVFQAVEEAMDDILALVNRLVNTVSAANMLITADHGFIYQRDRVEKSQKLRFVVRSMHSRQILRLFALYARKSDVVSLALQEYEEAEVESIKQKVLKLGRTLGTKCRMMLVHPLHILKEIYGWSTIETYQFAFH
ncbi:PglZ domain-containing protein [Lentibacillus sp. N15]|uniref:PglZ domain-containing protein n=1 Tax=Lentibacillus songyuanensis TaxID=3136161 RepID=UPI0031B9BF3F